MSTAPESPLQASGASAADRAILRTVAYSSLFQAPLELHRLHRGLMDVALDAETLRQRLERPFLRARLAVTEGLVHPRGREGWLALRRERARRTRRLIEDHRRLLDRIACFPFVRLVALSGACAHDNATDDDVDLFLVVRRGRAWSVTLALMLLSKWAGLRRSLCLNYVVDEAALPLPERDLFTATEVMGMRPLAGRAAYLAFVRANPWVAEAYPNFAAAHAGEAAGVPEVGAPGWLERLLDVGPAQLLEALARRVLGAHLRRKTRGYPGVVLSRHRLKLHIQDHRPTLLAAFEGAVRTHAGDEAS